ncbi:MAG: exonuclease SbcCD subunit D [candidate division Zixibacteria bacterium]|nr:exonuclease SbcCD subunit D [candidate division Zixibacteria bacterium]
MKLCHFADSHLDAGASHPRRGKSGLTLRQEDIVNAFVEAIDRIIDIKPDLCLHSGDLFDRVRPTNRIMAIAAEQLHRLAEQNGIPTVIISGNHDAPKQQYQGAALDVFRKIKNLYVVSSGHLETIMIGETCIHAVPHCLTGELLQQELDKCLPDSSAQFNILMAHGVAAGMPEFSMIDLGEQELPLRKFEGFDYVALGHFHNYCKVTSRAWYCGSTERLSQSEREVDKGFLEVDLEPFNVTFHKVNCRDMVDIQTINATGKRGDQLATIIRERVEAVASSDKIVRVRVEGVSEETLKTMPTDIISNLKQESFSLDINFQKATDDAEEQPFGRTAIGRLDLSFLEFLEVADLRGFDRERLKTEALKYLGSEE